MKLKKAMNELHLSATQIKRLAEENKITRFHRKNEDTKSWDYDDESIYAFKQYLMEKAKLDRRYSTIKTVTKRDGSIVKFDRNKIKNAITKAFTDVYDEPQDCVTAIDKTVSLTVNKLLRVGKQTFDITEIQSAVEQSLIDIEEFNVAKAYTNYRLNHDIARKKQTSVDYQVNKLFNKDDDVVNENANKDADVYSTKRDLIAGAVSKAVGLKMLPKRIADANINGLIHWHDLDYSPANNYHNCGLINLADMLKNGFKLGNADVESPHTLATAVAQASQILSSISSGQYGGCSYDRIDEVLAPYAKKSYRKHLADAKAMHIQNPKNYAKTMTRKEIDQSMQSFEYEINTLYSSNG